jgi:1-acyl-sn-glycerol-3-phosphate acyltransferase
MTLPADDDAEMRQLLAFWKLIRMTGHVTRGLLTVWLRFPKLTAAQKQERVMVWSQQLLECLAIRLIVKGSPPATGPVLLVANHISWIDIASVHAVCYCRFVAKSDLKRWPVIGTLTAGIGTLFIERESRRDAMRVVHHMADSLRAGDVLAVFPEGTTSDGSSLLPFHANLTQAAIVAQVPVQPVALSFLDAISGEISLAPAYAGDDSLLRSVWRTLSAPPLSVVVTLGELQQAGDRDRRAWTADLQAAVQSLRSGA